VAARAAQHPTEAPSADLMARVLADARAMQPPAEIGRETACTTGARPDSLAQQVHALFGGWWGLGAMGAAASAGLVVGLGAPDMLSTPRQADRVTAEVMLDSVAQAEAALVLALQSGAAFDVGLLLEESGS